MVENLRSSVSKSAIICIHDFAVFLGKSLDPELLKIIPILLKKTGEANRFINNEAGKALEAIVNNTTQETVLKILIDASNMSKHSSIKATNASLLSKCVVKMEPKRLFAGKGFSLQDFFKVALQFLNDGSFAARKYGQKIASLFFFLF